MNMPEGMIEERMDGIVREYAQYMANQGIRIDDYLKMIGTDMKTFRESMRATAEKQARTEVLLAAVAEAENVQISEEDLQAEYEKLGEAYGMKAEDVAKAIDVAGLTADLRRERAMSIISESGVAVEKKAEEPAKTEEASKAKKKPAAKKAAKTEETEARKLPRPRRPPARAPRPRRRRRSDPSPHGKLTYTGKGDPPFPVSSHFNPAKEDLFHESRTVCCRTDIPRRTLL